MIDSDFLVDYKKDLKEIVKVKHAKSHKHEAKLTLKVNITE